MSKISFNVNVKPEVLGDPTYFLEVQKELQPDSITYMGWNKPLIDDLLNVSPNTEIDQRMPGEHEHTMWRDGQEGVRATINSWANLGWPVRYHLLNEPDIHVPGDIEQSQRNLKGCLDFLRYAMDYAASKQVKLLPGNWGPGTVQALDLDMGLYDGYLTDLGNYSKAGIHHGGTHEYGSPIGPGTDWLPHMYTDPQYAEWWPKKSQLPIERRDKAMPPYWGWHRNFWFDIRADEIGAHRHIKDISEFGHDRMPHLESTVWPDGSPLNVYDYISQRWGHKPLPFLRGQISYEAYWKAWYRDWDLDEAMFAQYKWYVETTSPHVRAVHLFTWSYDEQWHNYGFNMANRPKFHDLLIAYAKSQRETPPPTEEPPIEIPPTETPTMDMLPYFVRGNLTWILKNNWGAGDEIVWTELLPSGDFYVRKNSGLEQRGVNGNKIYFGLDTTPGGNEMYLQFTPGNPDEIGAVWLPRHMSVGESYLRKTRLRWYSKSEADTEITAYKQNGEWPILSTWLKLEKIHAEWNGLTDVAEFGWYLNDADLRAGRWTERYFYGGGLLEWRANDGRVSTFAGFVDNSKRLPREVNWLTEKLPTLSSVVESPPPVEEEPPTEEPTPEPEPEIPPNGSLWSEVTLKPVDVYANLRLHPDTISDVIFVLRAERRGFIALTNSIKQADGTWYPVLVGAKVDDALGTLRGWMRKDVFTWEFVTPPVDTDAVREYMFHLRPSQLQTLKELLQQIA